MISAQFRIRLPEHTWVADVSRAFPEATLRLLSGRRTGDRAIELGETLTDSPDEVVAAMREHPAIENYDRLESDDRWVLGRYETTDTSLYEFADMASLPVEFPVTVTNGWYEFDVTGSREELDRLREVIEGSGLAYDLQSLVRTARPDTLLTDRQREVLEAARREGYFEVPRECTLADLAETFDIDKSTASTVLRRGEARLLDWFLTEPGREGRRDL